MVWALLAAHPVVLQEPPGIAEVLTDTAEVLADIAVARVGTAEVLALAGIAGVRADTAEVGALTGIVEAQVGTVVVRADTAEADRAEVQAVQLSAKD